MSAGFAVSTAAMRREQRQMRHLHAALILAAATAMTGALVAALPPGGVFPRAASCIEAAASPARLVLVGGR